VNATIHVQQVSFTLFLRQRNGLLWHLYACFTYPFSINYTNGVDMNWLYLLLVLALMVYLLRALTRSHE
jgi:hypothetical protein